LGLTAAWLLRIPKRIYTRHHATIHHREYPSGLKWDKLCNFLATDIIAISENVKRILIEREKAQPNKVTVIRHGFDFDYFQSVESNRIQAIREKLNLSSTNSPIIGVIARYTKWKGIQFIIDAFAEIKKEYPTAILVLANATGDYKQEIRARLQTLPTDSFREIPFEEDLAALYKVFDVYIHVPTDEQAEAFGQTYVEALLAGVPSVFTLSGVAPEFIRDGENALTVPFENAEAIQKAVQRILQDPELTRKLKEQGQQSVSQFSLDLFIQNLKRLYA
jgi:glycosyltransferase involved in cell wall biosynthesis